MASDANLVILRKEWFHFENTDRKHLHLWSSHMEILTREILKNKNFDDATTQKLKAKHECFKTEFEVKKEALDGMIAHFNNMISILTGSSYDFTPNRGEGVSSYDFTPNRGEEVSLSLPTIEFVLSGARERRTAWQEKKFYLNYIELIQKSKAKQESKERLERLILKDLEMRNVEAAMERQAGLFNSSPSPYGDGNFVHPWRRAKHFDKTINEMKGKSKTSPFDLDVSQNNDQEIKTEQMTIPCEECDVKIEDQSKLRLHEESVHVEMQCTPCGNSFNNICQLKEHVEIIHESCNTCMIKEELEDEKTKVDDEQPEDAIEDIEAKKPEDENENIISGFEFDTDYMNNTKDFVNLLDAIREIKEEFKAKEQAPNVEQAAPAVERDAKGNKETFAMKRRRNWRKRKKQRKKIKQWTDFEDEKTKLMSIPCDECEFDAENISNLNAHIEKMHDKKTLSQTDPDGMIKNLKYGQCELGESSSDMLKECKDSRQRYCKCNECKYCEANFTTSGELAGHFGHKHTHENPHKCPECDYMSVELSKLKKHMRCHSGEKPYQCECDICHSEFTQSNSLKEHNTIHTGDEPAYQ